MNTLYKKVKKTEDNIYGIEKIDGDKNPFFEGPCLLCLAAVPIDSSVFGMPREGMEFARLRVRNKYNAGYDIDGFPVSFLAMKDDGRDENGLSEFVEKYLYPLISYDGKKINTQEAMKNMRNVNILTYCNGTEKAQNIEELLIDKMRELGYSEKEIADIQSQMAMVPIATMQLAGIQKSTCISFKDVTDEEVSDNVTADEHNAIFKSPLLGEFFRYSDTEMAYLFADRGTHDVKAYKTLGIASSVILSKVLNNILSNSIENNISANFTSLTIQEALNGVEEIILDAKRGLTKDELRKKYDMLIDYPGVERVTEQEALELYEQEKSCDEIIRKKAEENRRTSTQESLGSTNNNNNNNGRKIQQTVNPHFKIAGDDDFDDER